MANGVLQGIAENIKDIKVKLQNAKELVSALQDAGENVVEVQQQLHNLEQRRLKWEGMLKNRGVM